MRYKRFIIQNYRAVSGPLTIQIEGKTLTPIVGVNESGKTTILHALFAFDHHNDQFNEGGRHLRDTSNLYRTSAPTATVAAVIELTRADYHRVIEEAGTANPQLKPHLEPLKKRRGLPTELTVTRNLQSLKYTYGSEKFGSAEVQDALAKATLRHLPYILFFDDFRDKVDERIEIVAQQEKQPAGWLSIIQQLFKSTDRTFSVFQIPKLEERQRKTILARVQRRLNETLTREWQNFSLDESDALQISLDFVSEGPAGPQQKHFIKLDVVETDCNGNEHFFFISDRSKGFYWFFNFVMKLEFNPKVITSDGAGTIYLLDEPGSYLHAFAQRKLCQKLRKLSAKNRVLYCTHSHYLLDPDSIPISSVLVAVKDGTGSVGLVPISEYKGIASERRSALQPVLDALQVKPFALDLITTRATVIVEGIYDYYALELFRATRPVSILPSVGADSIKFYISLLIAWQIEYRALWDRDSEGKKRHAEATTIFGPDIAAKHFVLLPSPSGQKRILQDLFAGTDLVMVRSELELPSDCSFEKTILALFHSSRRAELVNKFGPETRRNFEELFDTLALAK